LGGILFQRGEVGVGLFQRGESLNSFPLKKRELSIYLPLKKRGNKGDLRLWNLPWPLFSKEGEVRGGVFSRRGGI
jgi:hypothetical protein